MHDVRRGLAAAQRGLALRNQAIEAEPQRDRVAIVTFDSPSTGGAWVEQSLTSDYNAALAKCARLQAVGVRAGSTTVLTGLQRAECLLSQAKREAPRGRDAIQMVVLVLAERDRDEAALLRHVAKMRQRGWHVQMIAVGLDANAEQARRVAEAGRMLLTKAGWASQCGLADRRDYNTESALEEAVAASSAILVQ
jgi:hypothetical protein